MNTARQSNRRGFTLVELLVVIGIISILLALTAMAVRGFSAVAREQATRATIRKIHALLDDRMQAFNRLDMRRDVASVQRSLDPPDRGLAEVVARKLRFMREFPQTFAELQQSYPELVVQTGLYQQRYAQDPSPPEPPNPISPEHESAQVLYFVLTEASVLGYNSDATHMFNTAEVRSEINGVTTEWPYFVDSWGQPIRYYRWPTRLVRPQGYGAYDNPNPVDRRFATYLISDLPINDQELARDPADPAGVLLDWWWNMEAPPDSFEADLHTLETYYAPLLVSAGPDGQLGLLEPSDGLGRWAFPDPYDADNPNPAALFDNITNLNLRAGGR